MVALLADESISETKLLAYIKGPDFPTGCAILNSKAELKQVYREGRGAIRMRGDYVLESSSRGKRRAVITSVPYGIDKSSLVEKIADLIIAKRVPQLVDVRDESTDEVRIVLELAPKADADKAMAYLYKHTSLQTNFNVNLTALVPTSNPFSGRPVPLSLQAMLGHFVDFRVQVTRRKLTYEKGKLEERIHLLDGLILVLDSIEEVIKIVRKSSGRADAAKALQKRFMLSEVQAFFIVDLRIYQLSKTSMDEVLAELKTKKKRVKEIKSILASPKAVRDLIASDLKRISDTYGDARRCKIVSNFEEVQVDEEEYISHEDVYVIVTRDAWMKRIRQTNDPNTTRIREGDSLFFAEAASTRQSLAIFTNKGNVFVLRVHDLNATTGFGEPVQKVFRFSDGEQITSCMILDEQDDSSDSEVALISARGYGFRLSLETLGVTKRNGKKVMRVASGDELIRVFRVQEELIFMVTQQGFGLCFPVEEVPSSADRARELFYKRLLKTMCCLELKA